MGFSHSSAFLWLSLKWLPFFVHPDQPPRAPMTKTGHRQQGNSQAGKDPAWVGDPALAVPATRAEIAQALLEQKK